MKHFSNRETSFLGVAIAAACVVIVVFFWRSYTSAQQRANGAMAAHAEALELTGRIIELRSKRKLVDDHPRPEQDLVARLEATLHGAGIASEALRQASMSEPVPAPATPYARQRANITLDGLSAPSAARFLAAWSNAEPLWTPRSVTLEYADARSSRKARSVEDRYTLRITLENIYLAQNTNTLGEKQQR